MQMSSASHMLVICERTVVRQNATKKPWNQHNYHVCFIFWKVVLVDQIELNEEAKENKSECNVPTPGRSAQNHLQNLGHFLASIKLLPIGFVHQAEEEVKQYKRGGFTEQRGAFEHDG